MSWRDDFNNGSLDTTKFGTSVAGDGAVAEASGTVNITMGAAVANGALVYLKDALVTANTFAYTIRHKIDGTLSGNVYPLVLFDGTPACGTAAVVNPNVKALVGYGASGLFIAYKDTAGTWQYWNQSTGAWSTTATYVTVNIAYWFEVTIIVKNGKFRISVRTQGDTKSVAETLYINFTSLQAYTTLRIFWGDAYTDYYYCTSMKSEYCIFSDATPVMAYYNGGDALTNTIYKIGRAISFDGGYQYLRNPIATLYLIGPLAGESHVKDPWIILVSGTYYLFYTAYVTATSKWRIRYATSADQETWTDQGYITTPGGAGAYDEKGHRFPIVTYSDGLWRMYVGGQNASDLITVGYFYDASLATLTNYASNPVITVGAGGAWNDSGLLPVAITASGATISLHCLGLKASTAKWQGGVWTSTDWITWTPDGGNPIVARDVSKQTSASTTSAGDITLTVSDSTIFSNDDPIIIGNASVVQTNRVLSKADSTHITLYYPTIAATTPTVSAYNWGSVGIEGLDLTNFPNDALGVAFQTQALLCETIAWWHYSAGWAYDPAKTPPLTLGVGWDAISSENLKWIHNGITLEPAPSGVSFVAWLD
jgi:hypothetical protein